FDLGHRVGHTDVPGHHGRDGRLLRIEALGHDASHQIALRKQVDQFPGIEDGHRADVAIAHHPGHIPYLFRRLGVNERTTFDDFGDLLHTRSSAVFGFLVLARATFPRPSYAAYLNASLSVGKLNTLSMNALIVPSNCITIMPMCNSSEAFSPTMCTPWSLSVSG